MARDYDSFITSANENIAEALTFFEAGNALDAVGHLRDAIVDVIGAVNELAEHSSMPREAPGQPTPVKWQAGEAR